MKKILFTCLMLCSYSNAQETVMYRIKYDVNNEKIIILNRSKKSKKCDQMIGSKEFIDKLKKSSNTSDQTMTITCYPKGNHKAAPENEPSA